MKKIGAITTTVEEYVLKLLVNVEENLYNTGGSVESLEKVFRTLRDCEVENSKRYVEREYVRALLSVAKKHGAYFAWMKPIKNRLHVEVSFKTPEGLEKFSENFSEEILEECIITEDEIF